MAIAMRAVLAALLFCLSAVAALGDDWVAIRLRGTVLQLVDGEWLKLHRNDVVPDSRVIRTLNNGNVEFQRGEEHVALGPDTQIQIYDEARVRPFTTVKQYFGTVTVEAEVRHVQHFAVQNRYLAAVVKGTRFTVTAGDDGASVEVGRGAVFVEDRATRSSVTVTAGQSATVDKSQGKPAVSGRGRSEADVPAFARLLDTGEDESGSEDAAGPGKGKPEDGDKGRSDDDDKPGKGKPDDNPGKSGDHSGKGKSGDNSGKGKSGDNSGKGKSGDNSGKGKSGDNSGKGKGKSHEGD